MHKTMASVASLEKIGIIRSQEFMLSKVRLKFLKKMINLGPKTAILGPQFCRILVLGPHFWWSGEPGPRGPPWIRPCLITNLTELLKGDNRGSTLTGHGAGLCRGLFYMPPGVYMFVLSGLSPTHPTLSLQENISHKREICLSTYLSIYFWK